MSALRVLASRRPSGEGALFCCVGEDEAGRRWGFLEDTGAGQPTSDVDPEHRVAVPAGLSTEDTLTALAYWPAWRVTELAGLELGSRVLVLGTGWLARSSLVVCRLRGCEWRASQGLEGSDAEHVLGKQVSLLDALQRRQLPERPDAVICAGSPAGSLEEAARVCRSGGSLVVAGRERAVFEFGFYPDVHRRGLRLVFAHPTRWRSVGRDDEEELCRLARIPWPSHLPVA